MHWRTKMVFNHTIWTWPKTENTKLKINYSKCMRFATIYLIDRSHTHGNMKFVNESKKCSIQWFIFLEWAANRSAIIWFIHHFYTRFVFWVNWNSSFISWSIAIVSFFYFLPIDLSVWRATFCNSFSGPAFYHKTSFLRDFYTPQTEKRSSSHWMCSIYS